MSGSRAPSPGVRRTLGVAQSIEQLSFELTASALAEQERALARLRTCAGAMLGAASIAGSFLGSRVNSGALDIWSTVALSAFALSSVSSIWVLAPHELAVAAGGNGLLADGDRLAIRDMAEAYRALASWVEPALGTNRRTIDRLTDWLTASCVFLAIEVLCWTLSLVG
jgi:hypothetical protein